MPRQIALGIEGGSPSAQQHSINTMNPWCPRLSTEYRTWVVPAGSANKVGVGIVTDTGDILANPRHT